MPIPKRTYIVYTAWGTNSEFGSTAGGYCKDFRSESFKLSLIRGLKLSLPVRSGLRIKFDMSRGRLGADKA